jgi:hypothetical protein
MTGSDCGLCDSHRRVPRRGPTRTLRAATGGSLRSGPQRLYPHRGPRLAQPEISPDVALTPLRSDLKTIHH